LTALHQTLLAGLSSLQPRLSGYASGLSLLPDMSDVVRSPGVPQFNHIADCLELFDSFLLGRWANDEHQLPLYYDVINGKGQDDLAEGLVTLCAVCNIILRNSGYEDSISIGDLIDTFPFVWLTLSRLANRCLESALRVLINVSHENPTWCELLLHQELMIPVISSIMASSLYGAHDVTEETGERDAQAFDRLCLALGLLTNLVQVDKNSKDLCRETSELLKRLS
jgi:Wings apart-like protein regulation of heterochromatin